MSKVRIFGSIEKADEQDDGTIIVYGAASSEALDSQGEVVTAKAMTDALPDYMKFGAIREMHQPMAAGTALKCFVDENGVTQLQAHIVDTEAVKKVKHGVYKGFSIGGKVSKRDDINKNTITGIRLTEISLVDRPANPEAVFSLGKVADDSDIEKWAGEEINDARTAIEALQSIFWLLDREMTEAEKSPEQVTALKAVVENLKNFIASEIKEDNSASSNGTSVLAMSDAAGDLLKAGAKFSKATKETLSELHKSVQAANEHLNKLGYADKEDTMDDKTKADNPFADKDKKEEKDPKKKDPKDDEEEDDEKDPKDKKKAKPFEGKEDKKEEDAEEKEKEKEKGKSSDIEDLKKSMADSVAKLNDLTTKLAKSEEVNADLQKQVDALKALPAPPKGAVTAVAKGADASGAAPTDEVEPIRKGDGTIDEVATLIKSTHRGAVVAAR